MGRAPLRQQVRSPGLPVKHQQISDPFPSLPGVRRAVSAKILDQIRVSRNGQPALADTDALAIAPEIFKIRRHTPRIARERVMDIHDHPCYPVDELLLSAIARQDCRLASG